jgi:hypothetical protein
MYRRTRFALGALAALTALTASSAVAMGGEQAQTDSAGTPAPVVSTVAHGPCHDGGSVTLQADRAGNTYVLTATAQGLPEDTRWRLGFGESSDSDSSEFEEADARAVVHNGGWTVTRTLAAIDAPYFSLVAFGPGKIHLFHGRFCSVLAQPTKPLAAVTFCHKSMQLGLVGHNRPGVGFVVAWVVLGAKPDSRATVTLDATNDRSGVSVSSHRRTSHRGFLLGKDVITGLPNPALRLNVIADGGQRCSVSVARALAQPDVHLNVSPRAQGRALPTRSRLAHQLRSMAAEHRRLLQTGV